jgi:uncharacterized membrane protein
MINVIPELKVFLVAMSPVVELRGAIPLAVKIYGFPLWQAFFISVAGNLVPLCGIVVFGRPIANVLSKQCQCFKKFFDWLFTKVRAKTERLSGLGKNLTVLILTAIPIPFVGGWTGAIAAFLLEVPAKKSVWLVTLGAIVSGAIVSFLTIVFN